MSDLSSIREEFRQCRHSREQTVISNLISTVDYDDDTTTKIQVDAQEFVRKIRTEEEPGLMESFLAEYGLSTDEGVALMCLAEAYLRTPDDLTMDALIRDKIGTGEWSRHRGGADSPFVNVTTWALMLSGRVFKNKKSNNLSDTMLSIVQRLGEPVARVAVGEAMKLMGRQFVLGRNIEEALNNGKELRKQGYSYSYDMLGEAARTALDAQRYFLSYSKAISAISARAESKFVHDNPGISIKLSALHPRYEFVQRERVMNELVPRISALTEQARAANIGMNIDAEEMDRLDLSLDVIEAVLRSRSLKDWDGFGVVVQAYSKQASSTLKWLYQLASDLDRKISVRLVKGAYWDTEIKNMQVMGSDHYPVFTRKQSTDVSYIACAKQLFEYSDRIYPQFATHNAQTVSTILNLASPDSKYEFQRLHGMGESLHQIVKKSKKQRCRIYAPVGIHKDLLAYLVRRLLENGANSSFVNQVLDHDVPIPEVVLDPIAAVKKFDNVHNEKIAFPYELYGKSRKNSTGWNLNEPLQAFNMDALMEPFKRHVWEAFALVEGDNSQAPSIDVLSPIDDRDRVGSVREASLEEVENALQNAENSYESWLNTPVDERAMMLDRTADLFEKHTAELIAITTREAGKTRLDGVAEVREAVDFLRYYAVEARNNLSNIDYTALGPVVCISPWNFPLAIFTGPISAALAAGNTVIAKPAEQTPLISHRAVELFHEAGVPKAVLSFLPGEGSTVGRALTSDKRIKGVCFTGSTQTARLIDLSVAKDGDPGCALVAETGGLNAMIIDSSALPEQAVRDIVQSAYQSAGQRCSALRLLIIQKDIAPAVLEMIEGAANELVIGDSWNPATDVGPVIDKQAMQNILDYTQALDSQGKCLFKTRLPTGTENGMFVAPSAYKLDQVSDLKEEIFGPVLHVVTYQAKDLNKVVTQINESGYGLTLGVHSRVDARMDSICEQAEVGNIYLNRNQIGAVVGVQPFGGHGLSGTGPKAGGPCYVKRLYRTTCAPTKNDLFAKNPLAKAYMKALDGIDEDLRQSATNAIISAFGVNALRRELAGPTGERNTYSLYPRGSVLCAGTDISVKNTLLAQCILSVVAGNKVIITSFDNDTDTVKTFFKSVGTGLDSINVVADDLKTICQKHDMEMVVSDHQDLSEIRQALSQRPGARVPLFNSKDAPEFYYTERVISEDTTASGGNAKLIAGS